jgi:hypothetical protein
LDNWRKAARDEEQNERKTTRSEKVNTGRTGTFCVSLQLENITPRDPSPVPQVSGEAGSKVVS